LDRIEALQRRIEEFLTRIEHTDNYSATLGAFREMRSNLELIGEVTRELDRAGTINLALNPEWLEIRGVIIAALEPHPAAREAVFHALTEAPNGNA
jgi:hypothetical protein